MAWHGERQYDQGNSSLNASNPRHSCLLLFSNPFEGPSTSTSPDKQIEFIPIVAEQRYVKATRDFIEQSSPLIQESGSTSPISLDQGMESKTFQLPGLSNRSRHPKLPPIITSFDHLPATVYNPLESDGTVARQDSKEQQNLASSQSKWAPRLPFGIEPEYGQLEATKSGRYRDAFEASTQNVAYTTSSHVSEHLDDPEAFLAAAFRGFNPIVSAEHDVVDYSERVGIPSPVAQSQAEKDVHMDDDQPIKTQYAGLEAIIRAGLYDTDSKSDEHDLYITLTPSTEHNEDMNIGEVNVHKTRIHRENPEIDSVHAQIFTADPFGMDLCSQVGDDLSMRATLFPIHATPVEQNFNDMEISELQASDSSAESSISESQSSRDLANITKDFHQALSSIAKDKALPMLPNIGNPAPKAISILGQYVHQTGVRPPPEDRSIKRKPSRVMSNSLLQYSNRRGQQQSTINECKSRKQQFKAAVTSMVQEAAPTSALAASNHCGRSSKADSVLGMGAAFSPSIYATPNQKTDAGPRTNSTLFNKLYSQVLKPTGSYRPESGFSAWHANSNTFSENSRCFAYAVADPVKRSTATSTNTPQAYDDLSELPTCSGNDAAVYGISEAKSPSRTRPDKQTNAGRSQPVSRGNSIASHDNFEHLRSDGSAQGYEEHLPNSIGIKGGKACYAYKTLEKQANPNFNGDATKCLLPFRDMVLITEKLRTEPLEKDSSTSVHDQSPMRRKPAPQAPDRMLTPTNKQHALQEREHAKQSPRLQSVTTAHQTTHSGSPIASCSVDYGSSFKVPTSPVKKMFFNTVEKIGRIMEAGTNPGYTVASNGIVVNEASDLKISVCAADQNRLFGDLEFIIQDTANRFLLFQHARGRLSSNSVEKQARAWYQKNRPQVAQFLYPISIQRDIVAQNLDTITFHGPLAGNATAIQAIMHTWKYVARELAIRSFCLPDPGLQHFLREAARLLESLGVTDGHMLHFHAWYTMVAKTIQENYRIPYSVNLSSK